MAEGDPTRAPTAPYPTDTSPPRPGNTGTRLGHLVRLTRLTTGAAAIGNAWFIVLWTDGMDAEGPTGPTANEHPLWLRLTLAAICSAGLFAYGAGLNDVLDAKRDRALHPARPIAGGGIGLEAALALMSVSLVIAVLAALPLGTAPVVLAMVVALGMLAFNAGARFVPAIGLVMLGLIYAVHMLVFNPELRFLWPTWVVMTSATAVGLTTHMVGRRVPRISGRAAVALGFGWGAASIGLWSLSSARNGDTTTSAGLWVDWVPHMAWLPPTIVIAIFTVYTALKLRREQRQGQSAERLWRYGNLFHPFHAAAWLFGAGLYKGAAILFTLAIVTLGCATALREALGLIEHPPAFRRQ
ncbi:MAG: UbiA family prenyltransferase [Planctomycetota bacterium]